MTTFPETDPRSAGVERSRRSAKDVVLGGLLVLGGFLLLGYASWATKLSVVYVGWLLVAFGVIAMLEAVVRRGRAGFWSAALGGALMTALGFVFLRNPELAAVTLTLAAGLAFLVAGLVRLVAAVQEAENRLVLLLGGLVSTALGLIVLLDIFSDTLTLLGVLLAVEVITEGLVMMAVGRGPRALEASEGRPG